MLHRPPCSHGAYVMILLVPWDLRACHFKAWMLLTFPQWNVFVIWHVAQKTRCVASFRISWNKPSNSERVTVCIVVPSCGSVCFVLAAMSQLGLCYDLSFVWSCKLQILLSLNQEMSHLHCFIVKWDRVHIIYFVEHYTVQFIDKSPCFVQHSPWF